MFSDCPSSPVYLALYDIGNKECTVLPVSLCSKAAKVTCVVPCDTQYSCKHTSCRHFKLQSFNKNRKRKLFQTLYHCIKIAWWNFIFNKKNDKRKSSVVIQIYTPGTFLCFVDNGNKTGIKRCFVTPVMKAFIFDYMCMALHVHMNVSTHGVQKYQIPWS